MNPKEKQKELQTLIYNFVHGRVILTSKNPPENNEFESQDLVAVPMSAAPSLCTDLLQQVPIAATSDAPNAAEVTKLCICFDHYHIEGL